jgi:hypothetical protein
MALEPINLALDVDLDATPALEVALQEPTTVGLALGEVTQNYLTLETPASYELTLQESPTLNLTIGDVSLGGGLPPYHGSIRVTPSQESQTLPTANTSVYADIVIDAIPSNYGLITWDGSTLVVS